MIRTSTQVPFLVGDELCHIFGLERSDVGVFTARVGGGFGGKQELLTEDIVALAVLCTGRPVQYEFTRTDEFTISPCRHPMRVDVTAAAGPDGALTALSIDVLSDAGAYGNHSPGVLFHGCGESVTVYHCENNRVDAQSLYTNNIPSGAFRGYGLGQVMFGVESAMDDLAAKLGIDPFEFRRRNIVVPGDHFVDAHIDEGDLRYGSYGLDQCIDLAEKALQRGGRAPKPHGPQWRTGEGMAVAMISTAPAARTLLGHQDHRRLPGHLHPGTGNSRVRQRNHHRAHTDRRHRTRDLRGPYSDQTIGHRRSRTTPAPSDQQAPSSRGRPCAVPRGDYASR